MTNTFRAVRVAGLLVLAATAGGCVSRPQPLYYWGSYQTQVYGQLTGEKGPEEQIEALEQTREKARAAGLPLPPGFQAHLAMLYGKTGRSDKMVTNLEAEKNQFPESATFMDFVLKKLRPEASTAQAAPAAAPAAPATASTPPASAGKPATKRAAP